MEKENTYIGSDGLLYCSECKEALEAFFPKPVMGIMKHSRMCLCMRKENEKQEKHAREVELKCNRSRCFQSITMHDWTFENDNGKNSKMDIAKKYVNQWSEMKAVGSGLLLWGSFGTGKSYMAGCIANALIDQGVSVRMTNFSTIINDLFNAENKNEYIRQLCNYELLILDDLGIERNSDYCLENIFNVVDARYVSGKPMIITTNMEIGDLKDEKLLSRRRIYDRILERCIPLCVNDCNIRKIKHEALMENTSNCFEEETYE